MSLINFTSFNNQTDKFRKRPINLIIINFSIIYKIFNFTKKLIYIKFVKVLVNY